MESQRVEILYNKRVTGRFFRIGLKWKTPAIAPGHFVMIRVAEGLDPLLRRPFGIYNVLGAKGRGPFKGSGIELLYQVVGKGTQILSEKMPGDPVDILGPLGNGFPSPPKGQKAVMIAGGMGIVPLHLFARKLKTGTLLFGTKSREEAVVARDFRDTDFKVKIATQDGSMGTRGLVTDLLAKEDLAKSAVYACGPVGMLKAASAMAKERGVKCYVSLERAMACGIGVCLGCAVKAKSHEEEKENRNYRMVCSEGPVFDSEDIDWEAL